MDAKEIGGKNKERNKCCFSAKNEMQVYCEEVVQERVGASSSFECIFD